MAPEQLPPEPERFFLVALSRDQTFFWTQIIATCPRLGRDLTRLVYIVSGLPVPLKHVALNCDQIYIRSRINATRLTTCDGITTRFSLGRVNLRQRFLLVVN